MIPWFKSNSNQCVENNKIILSQQNVTPELLFLLVDSRQTKYISLEKFKSYYIKLDDRQHALQYQGEDGDTLIIRALKSSRGTIAKFLVEEIRDYKDLDIQNNKGKTALHSALSNKWNGNSTFKVLVDKGASLDIADDNGKTILDLIDEEKTPYQYGVVVKKYLEENNGVDPTKSFYTNPGPQQVNYYDAYTTLSSTFDVINGNIKNNTIINNYIQASNIKPNEESVSYTNSFVEEPFNAEGFERINAKYLTGEIISPEEELH